MTSVKPAVATIIVTAALLLPHLAAGQTYLVDTGAAGTTSIGAPSLFASGSTTCSPQPQCASNFQFLGAQFTLTQAAAITSIEAWMGPFGSGGSLDVKIRSDNNGLPGIASPIQLRPGSIFSKTYVLPSRGGSAGWITFGSYDTILAAGTYWITLEPVAGSGLNYNMPKGAANPLAKYAFYGNGNPGYVGFSPNPGLGFRIAGTSFPGYAFGSATRTLFRGSLWSSPVGPFDFISGAEGRPITASYIFYIPAGFTHARGRLTENGLSAGAYAFTTGDCISMFGFSTTCTDGGGRGIAYRTFMNLSNVAKTFRVNAVLDGVYWTGGKAAAGVYAFETTAFTNVVNASGKSVAEYLLGRDGFAELSSGGQALSLATLFPGAVLASDFQTPFYPLQQLGTTTLTTGFLTLGPNETVTIVFDVSTYGERGDDLSFSDTLKPAANLFTDINGNAVPEIVALGPSAPKPPTASSLTLSPATATSAIGTLHSLTATATTAAGAPAPGVSVQFSITSGPNAGVSLPAVITDSAGQATLAYSGEVAGTDTVQASVGTLQSPVVEKIWTAPGALDHITMAPLTATIAAGGSQPYTAEAFDAFGNTRGDVTGAATLSITPDGSCVGATCGATVAGPHTVTANYLGKTATASLDVVAAPSGYAFSGFFAPVDNAPVLNLTKAGSAIPVKFGLNGNQGLNILAAGYPVSQPIACDPGAPVDVVTETLTAGASGLTYDAATDQYTYVWKTEKGWADSCRQFTLRLTDGTNHVANFRFTK